ncbi:MAG: hypothetical protein ACI8UO_001246 [Verrucomicrobiales bacterium]|jgi:hypothetical protein
MPINIHRRRVLKLLASSGALAGFSGFAQVEDDSPLAELANSSPRETATDPNLFDPKYHENWKPFLSDAEIKTVTALCDVILPADEKSPAASEVGVPDFIVEWTSAPYEDNQKDAALVRKGLAWLNGELDFAAATDAERTKICDRIADSGSAAAGDREAAKFFNRFRQLVMGGFYTTPEGRADLGYIGNVALGVYPGASEAALKHLGLV